MKRKQLDIIIERLRNYIPVGAIEKKAFGEVFTPFELVNEMLDTLPEEVWSNPNLKWADLCNGMGNFLIMVARRLMDGLRQWEPNEGKRWKHIMENMIYAAELQPKNMFLWILSVDPKSKLKLNVYTGDSLKMDIKEVWEIDKFDVIVGNPPYQKKVGPNKNESIWHLFIEKYISNLCEGGYMTVVHPSAWRNAGGAFKKTQELLKSKKIMYLEIHDLNDGVKTFGAQTSYDWYCLQNLENNNFITKIKCLDNTIENINISNLEFIPSRMFDIFNKVIAKKGEGRVKLILDSSYHTQKPIMSKNKTHEFKYPCIYTITKGNKINLWWSNTIKGHFGIPKVIWSNGSATEPIIDKNGDYGITQFSYGIIDEIENFENIKKAMINKKFIKLMNFSEGDKNVIGHKYNKNIISLLKKDFWKEFIDENDN